MDPKFARVLSTRRLSADFVIAGGAGVGAAEKEASVGLQRDVYGNWSTGGRNHRRLERTRAVQRGRAFDDDIVALAGIGGNHAQFQRTLTRGLGFFNLKGSSRHRVVVGGNSPHAIGARGGRSVVAGGEIAVGPRTHREVLRPLRGWWRDDNVHGCQVAWKASVSADSDDPVTIGWRG